MILQDPPVPFTIPQALAGILSQNGTGVDGGERKHEIEKLPVPFYFIKTFYYKSREVLSGDMEAVVQGCLIVVFRKH